MAWTWYDSKVIKIEDQSPTTKRFWLKVDNDDIISFKAGQFVTMDLPIHEKRLKRWRSYSIANHPDESNVFEFCIVLLEGGLGTTYLFNEINVGATIRFKGPTGAFVLPKVINKDLVMICTGTGIAPFRSMLWEILVQKKEHQKIHLIFGTRHSEGMLYQEEITKLMDKIPGLSYSIALSRAETLPDIEQIDFHKGYVHPIYLEKYKTPKPDIAFLLCGWSQMVDEAVENLVEKLGYDKSQVIYELYG